MNTLSGMPVTMLNGTSFGCAECGGTCGSMAGLGAVTEADIRKYFIGKDIYVKNMNKLPIGVYTIPGGTIVRTVKTGETIGQIVDLNSKNNWGKLKDGYWISLAPGVIENLSAVTLSIAPPKGVTDAVGREVDRAVDAIPFIPSLSTIKWTVGVLAFVVAGVLIYKVFPDESKAAFHSAKKKLKTA